MNTTAELLEQARVEIERLEREAIDVTDKWLKAVSKVVDERDTTRAKLAEAVRVLEKITQIQLDKCETASTETVLMLLDHKVGLAQSFLDSMEPDSDG